jgi:putative ABC transport system permease protein
VRDAIEAAAARLARRLPPEIATRVFAPAWHDAQRRDAVRRRRARSRVQRTRLLLALGFALVSLALQSLRVARQERRAAHPFGGVPDPHSRGVDPMLLQDLRFAARMLWKKPGFTLTAVAVLALTIGANTAIFSIVQGVLLRPLPFDQPERIVRINETNQRGRVTVSPPNFVDWQAQNRSFEAMAAYDQRVVTLFDGEMPERVDASAAGAQLFDVLGVRPLLGRTFSAEDARVKGPRVVILGHDLWQRRFGGNPGVIGTSLTIDAERYEVIGVMPRRFAFPDGYEMWLPLAFAESELRDNQRGAHYVQAVGRLETGVTREQAEADIAAIERRIAQAHSNVQGYGIWLEPVFDVVVGEYRRPLWMLLGAVACVLLIGCANISNLLLARGTSRHTEMSVRAALGASRWRITRQLLAESTMLAIAGGTTGLLLAVWASRAMGALLPEDVPRAAAISLDTSVLVFTTVVSVLTGILFGLAPALEASRGDLVTSLKESRRDGAGSSRGRVRNGLVVTEVALALVLLAGAGLALRSFDRLSRIDAGFDGRGTVVMDLVLPGARYPDAPSIVRFYQTYLDALSTQAGVASAGAIAIPPLSRDGFGGTFTLIGKPEPKDEPRMAVRAVTPGYFDAARIPLRRGRLITPADRENAAGVAVITEAAARQYWPGEDPIGQRIRIHVSAMTREKEREVVGVMGDVRAGRIETTPAPLVYVPHAQYPFEFMTIFVRGTGEPMSLAPMLRTQLAAIDAQIAIGNLRPGDSLMADAVAQPRFRMILLAGFAATALLLAALGLYGVMSFAVSQRRSEIGLRIALGAARREVVTLVLRQGMLPVAVGIVLGLAGALAATSVMRSLLFGIEPFDPLTFIAVVLLLAVIAALACYLPARRAAAVDPLVALRTE